MGQEQGKQNNNQDPNQNNSNNNNTNKTNEDITKANMMNRWANFSMPPSDNTQNNNNNTNNNNINNNDNDIINNQINEEKKEYKEMKKEVKNEEENRPKLSFITLKNPEKTALKTSEGINEKEEQKKYKFYRLNDEEDESEPKKEINLIEFDEEEQKDNKKEEPPKFKLEILNKNPQNENKTESEIKKESDNIKIENKEEKKETIIPQNINFQNPINEEKPKEEKKKNIDFENVVIEKVFQISLDSENKKNYVFLEMYCAQILSFGKPNVFRLENLDEILLSIINDTPYKNNIINYLLKSYHRAYEMIEVRFKKDLGPKFSEVRRVIATYLGQIITSPENFSLNINRDEIKKNLNEYFNISEEEELFFLLGDFINNCGNDKEALSSVFDYLFEIIHIQNIDNQTFFKNNNIRKNIKLLTLIFEKYPIVRNVFMENEQFNPKDINGRLLMGVSYLGPLLSMIPWESPAEQIKNAFGRNIINENDINVKSYSSKLNSLIDDLSKLVQFLIEENEDLCFLYFYNIVNYNVEWNKMQPNIMISSTSGFLMNLFMVLSKLFFNQCLKEIQNFNLKDSNFIIDVVKLIDFKFIFNDNNIHFSKFDLIDSEISKKFIEDNKKESEEKKYTRITKMFFLIHCIYSYFIQHLSKAYLKTVQRLQDNYKTFGINNEQTKELFITKKCLDIYIRSDKFTEAIMVFNRISNVFLMSLNINDFQNLKDFNKDFYNLIDGKSNITLSSIPEILISNLIESCNLLRQFSANLYFQNLDLVTDIVYFALIYSSRLDLIHNPHLRSQIFDILLYTFLLNDYEKKENHIQSAHNRLLKDEFVKKKMILCVMRVFVDAERLGTSNQYYERFAVRNKVLTLINNVFKSHQDIFKEQILSYANDYSEDATKMLNMLMSDVTFLIDEVIQKLTDIKLYQDKKDDKENWDKLDEETKQLEENKFNENDRLLKPSSGLLNSSLDFLVIICNCLQKYFMNLKLAEKLAYLVNYCLDEFTSKSKQLKVKNKLDYNFNPSFILTSLIKIYVAFREYEEFIEYVVTDQRSYKYDNFLTAIQIIKSKSKAKLDYETSEYFDDFVNKQLKEAELLAESKKINYDDCPEEFLDPITDEIMEDPVILPSSNMTCDRQTIETQLLSNPIDPYTRSSLTKEMLIPNKELKERIDKYKKEKMALKEKNKK